jgi:hypothetical protein
MSQVYWLDPIRSGDLLGAVLGVLAGDARVAIEGEGEALEELGLLALPGGSRELRPPFSRQYKPDSAVVIMALENQEQARRISEMLSPHGKVAAGIEVVQVESHGRVEFVAADGFHPQCVSVGPAVPEDFLRDLTRRGIIEGFYSPSDARRHFRLEDGA